MVKWHSSGIIQCTCKYNIACMLAFFFFVKIVCFCFLIHVVFLFHRWWLPTQQGTSKFCTVNPSVWRTHQKWSVLPQCIHVQPHIKRRSSTHPSYFHPLSTKAGNAKHRTPPWSWTNGHWRVCTGGGCTRGNGYSQFGMFNFICYSLHIILSIFQPHVHTVEWATCPNYIVKYIFSN